MHTVYPEIYSHVYSSQWRHNENDGVSIHQPHDCLLNRLLRRRWKHQSSASLAFVRGIHRWPVNSPHKGPVTRKMFPFDDVIMFYCGYIINHYKRVWHIYPYLPEWQHCYWVNHTISPMLVKWVKSPGFKPSWKNGALTGLPFDTYGIL